MLVISGGTYIGFRDSGNEISAMIFVSTSSVSSAQPQLSFKKNVKPMSDVWDKIKACKPVNFAWKKAPNETIDRLLA